MRRNRAVENVAKRAALVRAIYRRRLVFDFH
jgi:hypothetical protein